MNEAQTALFERRLTRGEGCWTHSGSKGSHGYPQATWGKRSEPAHRVAWMIANGPIPTKMFVCHHCDNKLCARIDHLYLGTHKENMRDIRLRERSVRKITRAQAALIREDKRPRSAIAKEYGVNSRSIWGIHKGLTHYDGDTR